MSDLWLINGPDAGVVLISATAYTLRASDNNLLLCFTANTPISVTVPPHIGKGWSGKIVQLGTGLITVLAGTGVTLNNLFSQVTTAGRFSLLEIDLTTANQALITGSTPGSAGGAVTPQYATPLTGTTVVAAAAAGSVSRLVLIPAGTLATLTVDMSSIAPGEGSIFELMTTRQITALTVNGETFLLNANSGASWVYRLSNTTWYARY